MEEWTTNLHRYLDELRQMRERSGPLYDLAKERSRIVNEAWRAAGSPRHVTRVHRASSYEYRFYGGPGRRWSEPATEADWTAWTAWRRQREQLRRQLAEASG